MGSNLYLDNLYFDSLKCQDKDLTPKGSHGVEIKFSEAPRISRSMRVALENLQLDHLWVVYPGTRQYPVDEKITVLPLCEVAGFPQLIA